MVACVKIAKTLGCSIEYILDHSLEWIQAMLDEVMKQELEDKLFQLGLHGASEQSIKRIRHEQLNEIEQPRDIRIPLADFKNMGLKFGKPNKTIVIRGKEKK